jgi:hypothetical protein
LWGFSMLRLGCGLVLFLRIAMVNQVLVTLP